MPASMVVGTEWAPGVAGHYPAVRMQLGGQAFAARLAQGFRGLPLLANSAWQSTAGSADSGTRRESTRRETAAEDELRRVHEELESMNEVFLARLGAPEVRLHSCVADSHCSSRKLLQGLPLQDV
jgi:hypothetical protein